MGRITGSKRQHKHISVLRFGDKAAKEREFEKLYLESYGLVYNYVRYRMSDDASTEDVVSEAYMKAARGFDRFDPARSKFSTWVVNIAVNCMKSHYRKVKPTATIEGIPESAVSVQGGQEDVHDRDLVARLLTVLDSTERILVAMKYHEGMRNIDIAQELNMNASTVSTKLANALAKMRAVAERDA